MAGQPRKYDAPEVMQKKIDSYFESEKKPTISGLCYVLGFESRQSFYDYEKLPEYSYTIKRARLRMESRYETALLSPGSATGAIFALKNFGWKDKQELEHSGDVNTGTTIIVNSEHQKNKLDKELKKLNERKKDN
jgi:hypothetical protein